MNIKDMKRTGWRRCLEKTYRVRDFVSGGIRGRESVLRIDRITAPLIVPEGDKLVCIADVGYTWVQIAPADKPVWLTAMFDGQDRFVQIYFDLAEPPCFTDPDNPTFRDLYLDIVLAADRSLTVMDRDELDEALEKAHITAAEHAFSVAACDRLYAWLTEHREEAIAYVTKVYEEMK